MAQSKREQINVVGEPSKINRAEQNTVPDLLLQQHRWYLTRNLVNRLANRILLILCVGSMALVNHLSLTHLIASISVALMLTYHWHYERGLLKINLKSLEEILAKRSGEEWEDIYIQTKYLTSGHRNKFRAFVPEPLVWAVFVTLLGLLRFFFERKLGL